MEKIIWKKVKEFDSLYEISNRGQLRAIPRLVNSKLQPSGTRCVSANCHRYGHDKLSAEEAKEIGFKI